MINTKEQQEDLKRRALKSDFFAPDGEEMYDIIDYLEDGFIYLDDTYNNPPYNKKVAVSYSDINIEEACFYKIVDVL